MNLTFHNPTYNKLHRPYSIRLSNDCVQFHNPSQNETYNEVYDTFFNKLPLVQDVVLDIPASYSDNNMDNNAPTCERVKKVTGSNI